MDLKPSSTAQTRAKSELVVALSLFAVVLAALFYRCFLPGHTLFSNDGPLAVLVSNCNRLPAGFTGSWADLNGIGSRGGGGWPSVTYGLMFLLGPVDYAKFYAPIGLLILGLGAWCFFRQAGLRPLACVLGGLAAMLSSIYFSTACWGVVAHPIVVGMSFFALAALADTTSPRRWLRVALAGLAVGVGVADGADMGGILSIFVACYAMYQALTLPGSATTNVALGVARVAIVAVFAALFAAQAISVLAQVVGIGGGGGDSRGKQERWDFATQWSLPKREALSLIMPGLFGYRMDTPVGLPRSLQESYEGGSYWGAAGRDPNWDRYFKALEGGPLQQGNVLAITFPSNQTFNTTQQIHSDGKIALKDVGALNATGLTTNQLEGEVLKLYGQRLSDKQVTVAVQPPGGFMRYSGGGPYVGVLVALVGLWAAVQAFRRRDSVFTLEQRKLLWFWSATAIAALLFAFGRFAPFYQFLYALPYFSSIRNPAKFLHLFSFAIIVLFAYGIDALTRRKLVPESGAKPSPFDRAWVRGCIISVPVSLLAWAAYSRYRPFLENYLPTVGISETMAPAIAKFSIQQAGWFVLFFALAVVLFTLVLSGRMKGARAKWAGVVLGLFLVVDLGRANLPWILFVDYADKNEVKADGGSLNPVIELLRQKPYEHRVAILPFSAYPFNELYRIEWAQHHFQYYNIQSLDIVQNPRAQEDLLAFEGALASDGSPATLYRLSRHWELTNTRYLLGPVGALNELNQRLDPLRQSFRVLARFNLALKPGHTNGQLDDATAVMDPNGPLAVFEFGAALPRAKLYTQWQVSTNDQAALASLTSPTFDAQQTVLVANPLPAPSGSTNAGQVSFVSYAPKDLKFKADATAPSVLLLNDRFDPNWKVFVDGTPATLLRCNFIMRGVQLAAGSHQVEFRFEPPVGALYVSLVGLALGLGLAGFLAFSKAPEPQKQAKSLPTPAKANA